MNGNSLTAGKGYRLVSGDAGDNAAVGDILVAAAQAEGYAFASALVNLTPGPRQGLMVEALLTSDLVLEEVILEYRAR
jgi:hypothetical protein